LTCSLCSTLLRIPCLNQHRRCALVYSFSALNLYSPPLLPSHALVSCLITWCTFTRPILSQSATIIVALGAQLCFRLLWCLQVWVRVEQYIYKGNPCHALSVEVKTFFTKLKYSISITDEVIFYKVDGDQYTIVATATDDFTVNRVSQLIQKQLTERFEISDLGPINWLLGVSITRGETISLSQHAYIKQIITRFGLESRGCLYSHNSTGELILVRTHPQSRPSSSCRLRKQSTEK
jgi:hypothetical protein